MKFILYEDKEVPYYRYGGGTNKVTWVEAGMYPIIRMFDSERVLVNLTPNIDRQQLTILSIKDGEIVNG